MKKKTYYIVSRCLSVAAIIIFEIVMFYAVGEDALLQKGALRIFWICFPVIVVAPSGIIDYIYAKKHKNKQ